MFEDERGAPRHPVTCEQCAVRVLVKKNSLAHTVVQWTTTTKGCGELAPEDATRPLTATCAFLRDSIDAAVRMRALEVPEPDAYVPDRLPISGSLPAARPGPQ